MEGDLMYMTQSVPELYGVRVVKYIRCSHGDQVLHGDTLEAQNEILDDFIARNHCVLIDTFIDGDKTYLVMDVGDEEQQLIILENRSSLTNPSLGRNHVAYADVDGQHMYKSQYYPKLVARYLDLAT